MKVLVVMKNMSSIQSVGPLFLDLCDGIEMINSTFTYQLIFILISVLVVMKLMVKLMIDLDVSTFSSHLFRL